MDIGLPLEEQDNPRPKAGGSRGQFVSEEGDQETRSSLAGPKSRKAPPAKLRRPRGNENLLLRGGSRALCWRSESGRSDSGTPKAVEADLATRERSSGRKRGRSAHENETALRARGSQRRPL